MRRKEIITKLQEKGYEVETCEKIKNGVIFKGIMFKSGISEKSDRMVSPIIYTSDIIKEVEKTGGGLDDVVSTVENFYKNNKQLDVNVDDFFNRKYILNHLYIRLQKESNETITKRKCGLSGIESCLYIRSERNGNSYYSLRVNDTFLEKRGIGIKEAWEYAERNTNNESVLIPMWAVIKDLIEFGEDEYFMENIIDDTIPELYVVTNKCKIDGASAILNKKLLMEYAEKCNTDKIVVLPSSVHEMIIFPFENDLNTDDCSCMVQEVNYTQVKPEERLADRAYIIEPFADRAYTI